MSAEGAAEEGKNDGLSSPLLKTEVRRLHLAFSDSFPDDLN